MGKIYHEQSRRGPTLYEVIAKLMVSLLPKPDDGNTLSLDRTHWQFGQYAINLLVLTIVYNGVAFPVYWPFLDKKGNSNPSKQIALMEKFIATFDQNCIACLGADREFVGQKWFKHLRQQQLLFRIRIRHNFHGTGKQGQILVMALFQHLAVGECLMLSRKRFILGYINRSRSNSRSTDVWPKVFFALA